MHVPPFLCSPGYPPQPEPITITSQSIHDLLELLPINRHPMLVKSMPCATGIPVVAKRTIFNYLAVNRLPPV